MNIKLIDFFGVVLREENEYMFTERKNAQISLASRLGYIIHPDCCGESIENWLNLKRVNYNSTFYKTWDDVTEKNREQLWIDQIISYAINYGMDGNFDMNDKDYSLIPDIRKYKVILPISRKDLFDKCMNVICAGIALDETTCVSIIDFIADCVKKHSYTISIDDIKNKEAKIALCSILNMLPGDKFDLLRYIMYKSINSSMIIKDKATILRLKRANFDLNILSEKHLKSLASIFYRFKPLFLALKCHSASNAHIINKIRRMAKKYHSPMVVGFWENIVNCPKNVIELKERLENDKPNNFKIITILQAIRENRLLYSTENGHKMYIIRNGRVWMKDINTTKTQSAHEWWDTLEMVLYHELVSRLSTKACKVKLNDNLNLACPTSEKNFVGNIPFGSYFNMTEKNMIGIYWREEWGTRDFDLSYLDEYGRKVGWNSNFMVDDNGIIYSGDMTSAEPEASEVIYFSKKCPNGVIAVNRYSGSVGSKYMFSVAQSNVEQLPKNYMMDPNTIKFQTEVISKEKCEQAIGFVKNERLFVCEFDMSNARVSTSCSAPQFLEVISRRCQASLSLNTLLVSAGFEITEDSTEAELDLSNLNKDTLIELFAE